MGKARLEVVPDGNGHFLIRSSGRGRPVCVVYAHHIGGLRAKRIAEKIAEALS